MSGRSDWIAKTVTISESDPRSWLCLILKNFFIKRKGTSSDFYWCQFFVGEKKMERKKLMKEKKVEKLVCSTCARVCCKSKSTKILKKEGNERWVDRTNKTTLIPFDITEKAVRKHTKTVPRRKNHGAIDRTLRKSRHQRQREKTRTVKLPFFDIPEKWFFFFFFFEKWWWKKKGETCFFVVWSQG